ncbi:isopentenyl-diphosphate Delta-isomerase [Trinickia sp. LjRoot230]|uniref:isopentenyl-diphosphate Delta-isomerase n=1 Tax=Trinickia sp. LjRoot230 TaxID=3342288 RepID=UPI003ED0A21F
MHNINQVVLVNELDQTVGIAEKIDAHTRGLLHRAFSIFVVNDEREVLLQRRAAGKYHSASRWANTCCGHPLQDEQIEAAAHRRLREEMGFDCALRWAGVFRYRADVGQGLIEHEIDHLFIGSFSDTPTPNPGEVSEWMYTSIASIEQRLSDSPDEFAAWFRSAFERVRDHF